jgi:hypothetical protein
MGIGHGRRFRRRRTRDALVEATEAGRLRRLRRHPRLEGDVLPAYAPLLLRPRAADPQRGPLFRQTGAD